MSSFLLKNFFHIFVSSLCQHISSFLRLLLRCAMLCSLFCHILLVFYKDFFLFQRSFSFFLFSNFCSIPSSVFTLSIMIIASSFDLSILLFLKSIAPSSSVFTLSLLLFPLLSFSDVHFPAKFIFFLLPAKLPLLISVASIFCSFCGFFSCLV